MLPEDASLYIRAPILPPMCTDWYHRIHQTTEMEELISVARDDPSKFTFTWACWLDFHYSLCVVMPQLTPRWLSKSGQIFMKDGNSEEFSLLLFLSFLSVIISTFPNYDRTLTYPSGIKPFHSMLFSCNPSTFVLHKHVSLSPSFLPSPIVR